MRQLRDGVKGQRVQGGIVAWICTALYKPAGPVWVIAESSSGLGLALTQAALRQGHRVVLAALNTAAVQDLADPFPHTAIVAALDSTKPDDIARIVQEAKDRFGSVDVLVNTAGVGYIPAVEEGDGEDMGRQIDIIDPAWVQLKHRRSWVGSNSPARLRHSSRSPKPAL